MNPPAPVTASRRRSTHDRTRSGSGPGSRRDITVVVIGQTSDWRGVACCSLTFVVRTAAWDCPRPAHGGAVARFSQGTASLRPATCRFLRGNAGSLINAPRASAAMTVLTATGGRPRTGESCVPARRLHVVEKDATPAEREFQDQFRHLRVRTRRSLATPCGPSSQDARGDAPPGLVAIYRGNGRGDQE
jgi:hypothetical protein